VYISYLRQLRIVTFLQRRRYNASTYMKKSFNIDTWMVALLVIGALVVLSKIMPFMPV